MKYLFLLVMVFFLSTCAVARRDGPGLCEDTEVSRKAIVDVASDFLKSRGLSADWSTKGKETFFFYPRYVSYLVFFLGPPVGHLYLHVACDGSIAESTIERWGTMK